MNLYTSCFSTTGDRSRPSCSAGPARLARVKRQRSPPQSTSSTTASSLRCKLACPRKRLESWLMRSSVQPFSTTLPANGYTTACPAEKSGQEELDFKYGENFAKHIESFHPTICKVLRAL